MKILIPTIMYGRHEVFKVFAQGVINLQNAYPNVEIQCLVVGSGDIEAVGPYTEEHGFTYVDYPNQPLSAKAEYRLRTASEFEADYFLFLGSDDIMDVETFGYYLDRIKDGHDFIAPYDICYFKDGDIYYSQGYKPGSPRFMEPLAVGRCLSRGLLNRLNWSLWPSRKEKNIDREAYLKIAGYATNSHFFHIAETGGCIFDIKTEDNLSQLDFSKYDNIGYDDEYMASNLLPLLNPFRKRIHPKATIYPNVEIGSNVLIEAGAVIGVRGAIRGASSYRGKVIIGDNVKIGANVVIAIGEKGNTVIGDNCLIMNQALIGHNVQIARDVEIGAGSNICGFVNIGPGVRIKTGVNVRNRVVIAKEVTVGMGSNVVKDLKQGGLTYVGNPCEQILESK